MLHIFPLQIFSPVFLANPKQHFFMYNIYPTIMLLASFSHNSPTESA